jgi:hypothetical protein
VQILIPVKMKTKLRALFLILLISICYGSTSFLSAQKKFIYANNGRLYFPNGKEVSLWGVNFQPNLSWEYNSRLKRVGIPLLIDSLKKNADDGFDEIQKMKCTLIRTHLTPSDFTDDKGNLIENIYLDMLDYTLAEAGKRGIYVYYAFINHMGNGFVPGSFMNKVKCEDWIADPNTVKCTENYIKQLLNRINPYTKICYKDDPNIAVLELINEPGYYSYEKVGVTTNYNVYKNWLKDNNKEDNKNNYLVYRKNLVLGYINGMYDIIRETGAVQPVVWNCNWHKFYTGHEDAFEAAGESKVEVVSLCNYPGQNVVKQPYQQNPENLLKYDFTSFYKDGYEKKEWYAWALTPAFMKKAKVVYEFETFYNQSAYLYPAMADFFRSMGVQMAAMWTYCFPSYSQYQGGSHFLSLTCTPQKTASFIVAGEIFRSTPLYLKYNTASPLEKIDSKYAFSYKNNLGVFSSAEKYFYSGDVMEWNPLAPQQSVKEINGYGNSPLVKYDGTGIYSLKISDKMISITIQPDATWLIEPWLQPKAGKMITSLDYNATHIFELDLKKWKASKCIVYKIDGNNKKEIALLDNKLKFNTTPGDYIISIGK